MKRFAILTAKTPETQAFEMIIGSVLNPK